MPMNKNEANKRLIEKINAVEDTYPKNFSNTQKILLTTDGSITAILDVLYGKITLSTLEQHFEDATEEQINLNSMNLMSNLGEERFGGPNNNYIKEYKCNYNSDKEEFFITSKILSKHSNDL